MTRRLPLLLLLMIASLPSHAAARFVEHKVTIKGHSYRYQVFVPNGWTSKHTWPVVLFLHGSGERGSDNQKQMSQGLPPWLKEHGANFPAVLVIPQAPEDHYWTGDVEDAAMQALEASIKTYHGDRQRLYLTGLSMGGYGSWQIALDHPNVFAAAAIVCGGLLPPRDDSTLRVEGIPTDTDPYAWVADRVATLPTWIFHGAEDDVVPPQGSRNMHAALEARRADVRYTEFPGVNHGSWVPAYATEALWPWMFSHRLAATAK
ncbi:Alpha/beta hydrolase family protein [Dyella sp. OK004]|uniref:carboxylesterase family protein n=1 Tax=Dyella sp. OK004 TaxID=1855292 RepID=UPI0008E1EA03|nr:prolyl oligopeptidase family serine peptidase [Dyella sp. OK004]SFS08703.1 Alpha/beta hydrolase family protein [Dyella sp. OK004]